MGTRKNMFRVSKRVLAFLETDHEVDMNWVERILKNMLDGKLCYEKAKKTDHGTISNSNCNTDDRLCNV